MDLRDLKAGREYDTARACCIQSLPSTIRTFTRVFHWSCTKYVQHIWSFNANSSRYLRTHNLCRMWSVHRHLTGHPSLDQLQSDLHRIINLPLCDFPQRDVHSVINQLRCHFPSQPRDITPLKCSKSAFRLRASAIIHSHCSSGVTVNPRSTTTEAAIVSYRRPSEPL